MFFETDEVDYLSFHPSRRVVADEAQNMAEQLTADLQFFAEESGWPQDICKVLKVVADHKGSFHIVYPENYDKEIGDLEYASPPHSVLRRFKFRMESFASQAVNPDFIQLLTEAMLEF